MIKPNGKEITVNTSEEVLIKNESKDQKGKLAIPDLQVGDVLDYYICKEDIADKEAGNSYEDNDNLFFLVDEYPVLYYSLDFQFNKKIKIKTIYANGAKHFEESNNEEGDQLLSLKLHNIPKYQSQLWTSSLRQYPYVEIGSAYDDALDKTITKNHFEGQTAMFQAQKYIFETSFVEVAHPFHMLEDKLKSYFKDKRFLKNTLLDSLMKVLYAEWKYDTFCTYSGSMGSETGDFSSLKYRSAVSWINTANMAFILTDLKVNFDVLLVTSRYTNSLDNVFNYQDFDALIRINGDKPMYMFFDDVATHFNEIPGRFQGEKVVVLHPKRRNNSEYNFTEEEGVLPVSTNDQNNIDEQLNVSLTAQGMQKLKVERFVKQTGAMRHDDQKALLSLYDIDGNLTEAAKGLDIDNRFKDYYGGWKKYLALIKSAFDKVNGEKSKYFNKEIKEKFDQEPQEVSNCKIINAALDKTNPVFEYSETFVLDNLVKKAGNNFIIDAGKLTGGFLQLEEKNRTRDKDIYMPAARSFNYTIVINIPQGYNVRGVEEMAQKKSNKTGSFSSEAVVNGNKLTIKVARVYNNNFEKAADWHLLTDMIDTASDFNSKKILLEKQG